MSQHLVTDRSAALPFSVGGKVFVRVGGKKRVAHVVEDRGNIGRNGRRLLRVAFKRSKGQIEQVFEIPAVEVIRAQPVRRVSRAARAKADHN
jgi:hypothetical protein